MARTNRGRVLHRPSKSVTMSLTGFLSDQEEALRDTERIVRIPNRLSEPMVNEQHRHQSISWAECNGFAGMDYRKVVKGIISTFVLILGVIILTNPVLGYSRLLPGGIFELTFGGLLLASGLLLHKVGANTE
jgi:hypothetical protein